MARSSDVVSADTRHIWHPYTQHLGAPPAIDAASASGAFIHTADGRDIFDAISSWWVTLHGHSHPAIADAISRQAATLDQVIFTSFTHEPAALFTRDLVAVLPQGLNRVFFSDDGSTAVEVAVKIALQYHANRGSSRSIIVALENAYHGDTFGAMSVSGRGTFTDPFSSLLFDVRRLPDPTVGDAVASLDALIEREGSAMAAIIVEPLLMGSGGMRMYSADTLAALRQRARDSDILFIADEVLTGFGRTGPLFACEKAGIAPDIMCLSKGLTGGTLPLGATVVTDEIFDAFLSEDRHRTLFHGHSYTANPIACAAGRASLALLDDESALRRDMIHQAQRAGLARVESHHLVRDARVIGTVAAFDLAVGSGYLSPIGQQLATFALQRDILLRPLGNVVYVLPPFCATPDDIGRAYSVIEQFLASQ
ncbi:MAG TPA: adenosylmethionine--8-amino-7-oxononanoate transaminase [Gemmatimonadaceae bacterium]